MHASRPLLLQSAKFNDWSFAVSSFLNFNLQKWRKSIPYMFYCTHQNNLQVHFIYPHVCCVRTGIQGLQRGCINTPYMNSSGNLKKKVLMHLCRILISLEHMDVQIYNLVWRTTPISFLETGDAVKNYLRSTEASLLKILYNAYLYPFSLTTSTTTKTYLVAFLIGVYDHAFKYYR